MNHFTFLQRNNGRKSPGPPKPLVLKLERLILIRLLVVAVFLTLGAIVFEMPTVVYYAVLFLYLVMSFVYTLWLATEKRLDTLTYLQLAIDLLFITLFVHYTGGVDSVLATLYALVTVAAGFVFFPNAPLVVASLSSLFFGAVVLVEALDCMPSFIPPPQGTFAQERDFLYTAYMAYVRITIFMLIGFLSRYLVRSIDQMERNLQAKEKFSLLGELAMYLAHEIKNPLMTISGNIELLHEEMKNALKPENRQLMEAIVSESERLKELFADVTEYVRSNSLEFEPVNMGEVLDEVFLLAKPLMNGARRVQLETEYRTDALKTFSADRNRIKQVFVNLIANALEAMPTGGTLTARIRQSNIETKVSIKDSGQGMDQQTRKELFVPFKSSKKLGSGLGLAIAYKIVHSHGGKLKVKSRAGRGSTFMVLLPHRD